MTEKIKFYMDEHIPLAVVDGLLRRGVDVLTTQKAKMLGVSDMEYLILAKSQGRVAWQIRDYARPDMEKDITKHPPEFLSPPEQKIPLVTLKPVKTIK